MDPQPSTTGLGRPQVVIVGASCRALASSATAAGWSVHAADLFDDLDLGTAATTTRRVAGYPGGLADAAEAFPPGPWCYAGALENHPHVIARIAALRPLAGNDAGAVRCVRDPASLAVLVREARLRYPDTRTAPTGVPIDGSFLLKPRTSAAGRGIAIWRRGAPPGHDAWVWQRRIEGEPLAAILALADGRGRLLGVSRQLVGVSWCRGPEFGYCGSVRIRDDDVPLPVIAALERFASVLAAAGLRGVVGVDLVIDPHDQLYVIEVNPRPTSSAELVERATGVSIMATHLDAFGLESPARPPLRRGDANWVKAVLFAAAPVVVDAALLDRLRDRASPWTGTDGLPALADIPRPGQVLQAGTPLVTVFAGGETAADGLTRLRDRVRAVKSITG